MQDRPRIGVTTDVAATPSASLRSECSLFYSDAIAAVGGLAVLLPADASMAEEYIRLCDGFVLTGGDDPRTEPFGEPTHAAAKPIHPRRQDFETALLRLLRELPEGGPVLGICLGMQMMALLAGGKLHQHLPDLLHRPTPHDASEAAARHKHPLAGEGMRASHPVVIDRDAAMGAGLQWLAGIGSRQPVVDSHHHQAVADAGALSVVAHSDDGLIEAVAAPDRSFYLGVQWHPERTEDAELGLGLLRQLVEAAGDAAQRRSRLGTVGGLGRFGGHPHPGGQ